MFAEMFKKILVYTYMKEERWRDHLRSNVGVGMRKRVPELCIKGRRND